MAGDFYSEWSKCPGCDVTWYCGDDRYCETCLPLYRSGLLAAARKLRARAGVIRRDAKWYPKYTGGTAFYTPDGIANMLLREADKLVKMAEEGE